MTLARDVMTRRLQDNDKCCYLQYMVKKCKLKNDLICLESVLNQYPSVSFGKLGNTILQCSFADERAGSDPEKQYPGDMG